MNQQSQVPFESRIVGTKRVNVDAVDPFRFGNPRAMTDAMRDVLARSIDELGYVQPVMVREVRNGRKTRYEILDGHHRYDAVKTRGGAEIDVLVVDVPDDAKARKLALALNRIGADWTPEKLAEYVDSMLADGIATPADILATTGFAADELEQLASLGTGFLDDIVEDGKRAASERDSDGGGKGSGSAAPETQASGDRVKISLVATPGQHKAIYAAISIARKKNPDLTAVEALAQVCASYETAMTETH